MAFGTWRFVDANVDEPRAVLEAALDRGLTTVDTADVYGLDWGGTAFGQSEVLLGRVLAEAPALRDRMVLATKGGILPPVPYDSGRIREACEDSLRRLGVDAIDLYQIHRPDLFTHPAALAETLSELREAGKIREVGVSNFTPDQYDALARHLPFPIVTTQPQYSAGHLEPLRDGTFDRCLRDGVVPLAWSPLMGGALTPGAPAGTDGPRPELLAVLDELAQREDVDRSAIALAFVLAHPSRPVAIIGSMRPERLDDATRALTVQLDRTDCYRIIEASEGVPLP
jgi:predicted oxidoreductase